MNYFDHFAHFPGTNIGKWIKYKSRYRVFKYIEPFLSCKNLRILEIGGGMGELAIIFREANFHNYIIVEPNSIMRRQLNNYGFITRDYLIPTILEKDKSFDAIILVDVFEHLNDAREATQFIVEAKRVLKPGGVLCIMSPDFLHWKDEFFNGDYTHSNITSVRRLIQLFYNYGFHPEKYVYISGFFVGKAATFASYLTRFLLFFVHGNSLNDRLYRFKLTHFRQFLIIGTSLNDQ
jgi:SAM-dependent methyltransferase